MTETGLHPLSAQYQIHRLIGLADLHYLGSHTKGNISWPPIKSSSVDLGEALECLGH